MNNPLEQLLRWFEYDHLPEDLQPVSALFSVAAHTLVAWEAQGVVQGGPELTMALRKLLEGKDCAVRACLDARETVDA